MKNGNKPKMVKKRKIFKQGYNTPDNGESIMPIAKRRSVTIDKFVYDSINDFRASGIKTGLDIDFTTTLNMFAEYGILKMRENIMDPKLLLIFSKYLDYEELKESGFIDEWIDFQEFKEWKKKQREAPTVVSQQTYKSPLDIN